MQRTGQLPTTQWVAADNSLRRKSYSLRRKSYSLVSCRQLTVQKILLTGQLPTTHCVFSSKVASPCEGSDSCFARPAVLIALARFTNALTQSVSELDGPCRARARNISFALVPYCVAACQRLPCNKIPACKRAGNLFLTGAYKSAPGIAGGVAHTRHYSTCILLRGCGSSQNRR